MSDDPARAVQAALDRLAAAREGVIGRPWREITGALGAVGRRFLDPTDPLRVEALRALPAEAGLGPEMAETVLDGMAGDWSAARLRSTVEAEFEDPDVLDGPVVVRGREVMAAGPALCVQIVSGSVPGVGVNALVRSLLVKGPTLVKPGRGDLLLPRLFQRALAEHDPELAAAAEVLYWPSDAAAALRAALARSDVLVAYGSDTTVAALRAAAPATTRVVTYHHRVAVAVVGREVLNGSSVERVALDTARAVALFEQRGCVCPHRVYVEEGGELDADAFAERLASALEALESNLPSAPLDPEEGAALHQLRGTAELLAASGQARVRHGGVAAPWTVVRGAEPTVGDTPTLARGVQVITLADFEELASRLAADGRHLQSVGYAGLEERLGAIAAALGHAGAARVVPIERLSFPPPWWLHDGRGPLRELVRWVETERPESATTLLPAAARRARSPSDVRPSGSPRRGR